MRASLAAVYGIRLAEPGIGTLELADLTAHLPPGCALWRATGGALAWTDEMHLLAEAELDLRVLAWFKTEDGKAGRNRPQLIAPPANGRARAETLSARAQAWQNLRRQP